VQPTLATVHHLAGKTLISDWLLEEKGKEEVVKVSIDSGVVCKYTAFIAVDEESSELVSGALKTWDVETEHMSSLRAQVAQVQAAVALNISKVCERGDRLEDLGEQAEYLRSDASMFQRSAVRHQRKGGFLSSIGSMFAGIFSSSSSADQPRERSLAACKDEEEEDEEEEDFEPVEKFSRQPASASLSTSSTGLSALIALQQADGSWKLGSPLANLLSKTESVLEGGCPTECRGVVAAVWATVLVLTMLRNKGGVGADRHEGRGMAEEAGTTHWSHPQDFYTAAETMLA